MIYLNCNFHFLIRSFQVNISEEQSNAVQQKTLAQEYHLQVQELKNQLTDSRFERARSKHDESIDRFSSY